MQAFANKGSVQNIMENLPKVSIIIPSLDGCRDGNVERLVSDINNQTFQDIEIRLIKGIRPNGKARNEGSKDAKGRILIFIDDDIRLGNDKVLENLIRPLESDDDLAMTGASVKIYDDARYFQKEYNKIRNFSSPVKNTIDYKGRVGHACLAVKKYIFQELGGENEDLIRGTDVDLNVRIKAKGYKVAVAPNTWVYHLMPNSITKLIKEAFDCGFGAAYALKSKPGIFGLPKIKFINYTIKTRTGALIYKIANTLVKLPVYILIFKPVYFLFFLFHTAGYVYGWLKFRGAPR